MDENKNCSKKFLSACTGLFFRCGALKTILKTVKNSQIFEKKVPKKAEWDEIHIICINEIRNLVLLDNWPD